MKITDIFGSEVFSEAVMKEKLPHEAYKALKKTIHDGKPLDITVANTIANVCHDAELFKTAPMQDVGPYHARMITFECNAPAGGLLGDVKISRIKK
jgi:hypothetical protein